MKRMMIVLLALTMVFGLVVVGQAENVAEGVVAYGTGGLGSFFAPRFTAEGESVVYTADPTNAVVRAADACISGDKYRLLVKGADYKQKMIWISSGSLYCGCTASATLPPDQVEVHHGAASKIKLKAVALPGGIPASAYVTMEGSWTQTKGTDGCGY